jgi:two-component system response regulator RegA
MASTRSVRSVLVVDDDEGVLSACTRSLKRERKVFTANNAVTARHIARQHKPDVVIVDLRLGAGNGLDLIRDLKIDRPDVRIALVSGYLSITIAMQAVKAGAETVLVKPVSPREIMRHIEEGTTPEGDVLVTPTLERVEWEHISRVVADTNGNISEAARRLGVYRQTLQRRLRKPPKDPPKQPPK